MYIYIYITKFGLINYLEKDHCMIETPRLKNAIFIQTILTLSLSSLGYSLLNINRLYQLFVNNH